LETVQSRSTVAMQQVKRGLRGLSDSIIPGRTNQVKRL